MQTSRFFKPILAGADLPTRLIACLGAAIGIALTIVVCGGLSLTAAGLPLIVAPIGASAVLVYAVPASPLAQPWSVIGGNTVSTLVGVMMYNAFADPTLAAAAAVSGAIVAMSLLRCLHPPGGAAALTVVIGGPSIHAAGYAFAFAPVGFNSLVLVLLGVIFHRATGRTYPRRAEPSPPEAALLGLHPSDIDAALAEAHESFDISRADLDALLARAELHAAARRSMG